MAVGKGDETGFDDGQKIDKIRTVHVPFYKRYGLRNLDPNRYTLNLKAKG